MIAELTIVPVVSRRALASEEHLSAALAPALEYVKSCGIGFRVTAMGTLLEGPDDQIWDVARHCHELVCGEASRVVTEIRLDSSIRHELDEMGPPG